MNTEFINSGNSKTADRHILLLNILDKINLKKSDKYVALSNLGIHYTWKNFKKSYKNNKSKRSGTTWYEKLNCLIDHILYQIFKNIFSSSSENMR